MKAVAGLHLAFVLLPQSHKDWATTPALLPQISSTGPGSLLDACRSPDPKVQKSPYSSHTEGASLESCCWPSSAVATVCTEPQRLGLHACLATSKVNHKVLVSRKTYKAKLLKCKHLHIDPMQKVLALKAVAGPHLPFLLLAQSHKDWTSTLPLLPPTSNIGAVSLPHSCQSPAPKVQMSPDSLHTEGACLECCCWPWSALLTASTEPQTVGL